MNPSRDLLSVTSELRAVMTRAEVLLRRLENLPDCSRIRTGMDLEMIIGIVSKKMRVPRREIFSRDRHEAVARARHLSMVLIRQHLGWPYQKIGTFFARDHGSVLAGQKSIEDLLQTSCAFGRLVAEITAEIHSTLNTQPLTPPP